ncbi:DNA polymerase III subunit delta' [Caulobacter sp. S45]|uniref:DNA polymerase III subunit delta' n=1 Tax=Caulobacter sp. S45 TaxID=1641861 RepID=UPI0015768CEE|nr:DNA polymerase III subunit delta' [Caulobacter sp. S45]
MAAEAGPGHPRHSFHLDQVDAPAQAFEDALMQGRLHHAWLFTGPQGIGKASFAYRAARHLLGARHSPASGPLGQTSDDPVSRMVAAQSHPDLMVLERHVEGAAARKSIPVDEARRLPEFFSKAPALSPYRIAIIDAADDLNVNAANAVLKTLEEPSGRGVLLLVSHAPGRLLTTIRSRCRRLAFAPWPEAALAEFARERLQLDHSHAARLAQMAGGAPGRVLSLAAAQALALDDTAAELLSATAGPQRDADALRLADRFRGAEGAQTFALLLERLGERLRIAALGASDGGAADSWASLWERTAELPGRVEALNLDRADAFWSLLAELRATVRREGPAPC